MITRTATGTTYEQYYRQSVDDPDTFWAEAAKAIDWHVPYSQVLDYSNPPFARWFTATRASPRI